jgi:hypothetical protein
MYEVFNADKDDVRGMLDAVLDDLGLRNLRSKIVASERRISRVVQVTFPRNQGSVPVPERTIVEVMGEKLRTMPLPRQRHRGTEIYGAARLSLTASILALLLVGIFF